MIPYRITAPSELPVSLHELKQHLRVDHDDDDNTLFSLQGGVVAQLDGWSGVLGRCIMPQKWGVDCSVLDTIFIPLPDITTVEAFIGERRITALKTRAVGGFNIRAAGANKVTFECAMPPETLECAKRLIKHMVQKEYDILSEASYENYQKTIDGIIRTLRWNII